MEGISTNVYKTLKHYWRRRGYRRLNDAVYHRESARPDSEPKTGPGRGRKRRFWRVKIGRRIRIWRRIRSPKKWLIRLRDSYVKMMLNIGNMGLASGGYGGSGSGFGPGPVKEYDEKMIVEIYKSLVMAQGHLVHRQPAKLGSHPVR